LPPNELSITVPDIPWRNMTAEESARLHNSLEALHNHEHGHLTIAQHFVKNLPVERFDTPALGDYLVRELKRRRFKQEKALQARENLYDSLTEHGKKQPDGPVFGFPGGNSTSFECP
jgi:hypothetical protein